MRFQRMKHIATAIQEVALDTGYTYEFLCEMFDECIAEGQSAESAFEEVAGIAYEKDY